MANGKSWRRTRKSSKGTDGRGRGAGEIAEHCSEPNRHAGMGVTCSSRVTGRRGNGNNANGRRIGREGIERSLSKGERMTGKRGTPRKRVKADERSRNGKGMDAVAALSV